MSGRNVTGEDERYRLYRLCECTSCEGYGKVSQSREIDTPTEVGFAFTRVRCDDCRGEGRTRELVATATDAESVGRALITLAEEGEWEGCPLGLLDKPDPDKPGAWLIKPWLPSARNVSDAGRTLARSKGKA